MRKERRKGARREDHNLSHVGGMHGVVVWIGQVGALHLVEEALELLLRHAVREATMPWEAPMLRRAEPKKLPNHKIARARNFGRTQCKALASELQAATKLSDMRCFGADADICADNRKPSYAVSPSQRLQSLGQMVTGCETVIAVHHEQETSTKDTWTNTIASANVSIVTNASCCSTPRPLARSPLCLVLAANTLGKVWAKNAQQDRRHQRAHPAPGAAAPWAS